MKKRLFGVLLSLCMILSLVPFCAFASLYSNGELAYMDLAVKSTSEDVTDANGLYQKYIYENYDDSGTVCLLRYNMEEDYLLVTLVSANGTSSNYISLMIPSDLQMPYYAYSEFTMTESGATVTAGAAVDSSFSNDTTIDLIDPKGITNDSILSSFKGAFKQGLRLALACVQRFCFNDCAWSIGDLGFTSYARELGVPYGVSIPDSVPTVMYGKLGENVYWELQDAGLLYIYGSGHMDDYMTYTLGGESPLYQIRHFIKYAYIDDGVTNVGGYVFDQCSSLAGIYMAPSVAEIEYYAFSACNSLSDITIPYALKSIGDGAFYGCDSLEEVYYHGNLTEWSEIAVGQYNDPLVSADVYTNMHYSEAVARVNPTCTNEGTEAYWKCECGKFFSDEDCDHEISAPPVIPKTDHSWDGGIITKQPTEQEEGIVTYTCTQCGTTKTEPIPKQPPSPAPTAEPTATPAPTAKPTATPAPTAKPTAAPAPTAKPTATPVPTAKPSPTPAPAPKNPFKDVAKTQYYYEPVLWAVNHDPQITAGTSATTFSPANPCTRGQIVTFLWRAKGCPEPTITKNPFTDVKSSDYFYKAVLWAVEKEITAGTSKTTFSPAATVTRAQTVTFLWRAEGKPAVKTANPFKDVPAGQYYTDAVLWAVKNEITAGTSATTFSPANPCTRAQIVTFLYRDLK